MKTAQPAVETFFRTLGGDELPQKGQWKRGEPVAAAAGRPGFKPAGPGTTTRPRQPEHCAVCPASASEISNGLAQ